MYLRRNQRARGDGGRGRRQQQRGRGDKGEGLMEDECSVGGRGGGGIVCVRVSATGMQEMKTQIGVR
jgi:hypothetical protein